MAHNLVLRIGLSCIGLWVIGTSSTPAYGQRVWTLVSSAFQGTSLQFPTADTGYAVLRGDSLIRTTDGGQSWDPVDLPIARSKLNLWTSITFCDSLGWLLTTEVINTPTSSRLLQTTDYGFSWVVLPLDSSFDPPNNPQGIYFKSPSLGYLWGDGYFYKSKDKGHSWQPRVVLPCVAGGEGTVDAVGQPNVILGESSDEFYLNAFYLSTDTGATWSINDSIFHLSGEMSYIGSSTWVTYNAWTTDNGKTWDTISTTAQLSGVFTDTLGHGLFSGYDRSKQRRSHYDSVLYFTNDYGHSWDSAKVPFAKIESVAIIGDVWYAVTDTGGGEHSLYRSVLAPSSIRRSAPPSQVHLLNNPVTHFLKVCMEENPGEIRIVDFLGRTVTRYPTQGGELSINVSSLPEGLFWAITNYGALPFVHIRE